jgi:hypothetical protein
MPTDAAPARSYRHHWMAHTATHAAMRPDKPALRYLGETTTWAQLSRRSLQLAAALTGRGITEGDRVAMLTLNHPWFVEGVFAADSLGAMAVPLSSRLAPLELGYILADCTPSAIIVDAQLLPPLQAVPATASTGTVAVIGGVAAAGSLIGDEEFLSAHEPMELPDVSEEPTALIMYTSGTPAGRRESCCPAGTCRCRRSCMRAMEIFDDSDIGFLTAPFFHIAGLGLGSMPRARRCLLTVPRWMPNEQGWTCGFSPVSYRPIRPGRQPSSTSGRRHWNPSTRVPRTIRCSPRSRRRRVRAASGVCGAAGGGDQRQVQGWGYGSCASRGAPVSSRSSTRCSPRPPHSGQSARACSSRIRVLGHAWGMVAVGGSGRRAERGHASTARPRLPGCRRRSADAGPGRAVLFR